MAGFHIYKQGKLTVVGFDGRFLADPTQIDSCREDLLQLISNHQCQVLVVDLMEVDVVSSWILGILAAIQREGIQVELYHPTHDMRGVLETTHLDRLLHIRHEDVPTGDASGTDH